jgi:hypothetical protein
VIGCHLGQINVILMMASFGLQYGEFYNTRSWECCNSFCVINYVKRRGSLLTLSSTIIVVCVFHGVSLLFIFPFCKSNLCEFTESRWGNPHVPMFTTMVHVNVHVIFVYTQQKGNNTSHTHTHTLSLYIIF